MIARAKMRDWKDIPPWAQCCSDYAKEFNALNLGEFHVNMPPYGDDDRIFSCRFCGQEMPPHFRVKAVEYRWSICIDLIWIDDQG